MSTNTPKTFYLAGSNDGISWSLIDNETLASSGSGSSLVSYSSSYNTQQSFLYFRLIIPNNFGGATVQVADWQMFGTVSVQVIDSAGVTGQYGFTGLMSALGFTGWTGAVGFTGRTGATGGTGVSGRTGVTGPTGTFTGVSGVSGVSGRTGFTGFSGFSGFSGATGPLNQSTTIVDPSLLHFYTFSPMDVSGSGASRYMKNQANGTYDLLIDSGVIIDGTENIPNTSNLIGTSIQSTITIQNTGFTIGLWFYVNSSTSTITQIFYLFLLSCASNNRNDSISAVYNGQLTLRLYNGDGNLFPPNRQISLGSIAPNTWHHLIWSINGSIWTWYFNGVKYQSLTGATINLPIKTYNTIGKGHTADTANLVGRIDGFFIYDSTLTDSQIYDIYSKGQAPIESNYYYTIPIQYSNLTVTTVTGRTGVSGGTGFSGFSGGTGLTGMSGSRGFSGSTGPSGTTGASGIRGGTGWTGYNPSNDSIYPLAVNPKLTCLYTFEPMEVSGTDPSRRVKNQANGVYDLLLDTGVIINGTETFPNTASIDSIRNTAAGGNLSTSFNSATSFSIGSWFYYTTNTNTQLSGLFFAYLATSGRSEIFIFKYPDFDTLHFRIVANDLSGGSTYYSEAIIPININSWNFFTWVATSTSWTIYMNGTIYTSGVNMSIGYSNTSTPVFAINATFQRTYIGSVNASAHNFKDGKIDNFFIYSGALSPSEVADIYSKGQVPNTTNYYYTIPIQYYQPKLLLSYTGFTGASGIAGGTGWTGYNTIDDNQPLAVDPSLLYLYTYNPSDVSGSDASGGRYLENQANGNYDLLIDPNVSVDGTLNSSLNGSTIQNSFYLGSTYSIGCWFNTQDNNVPGGSSIFNLENDNSDTTNLRFIINVGNVYVRDRTTTSFNDGNNFIQAISINTWYHMVYVNSGSTWYVYVNGVLVKTLTGKNPTYSLQRIYNTIGRRYISGHIFSGQIDNFFIYNSTLTSTQVADIYSKGQVPSQSNYYYTVPIQYYQPKLLLSYTGFTGPSGITGGTGQPGWTGASGRIGWTGFRGFTAGTSVTGVSGPTGRTGFVGSTGNSGTTGATGTTGWTGITGVLGQTGLTGYNPSNDSIYSLAVDPKLTCLYTFEPMDVSGTDPSRRVKNQANGVYDLLLDTGVIIDGTETFPNVSGIDSIRNTESSGNLRTSFNSATSFSIGSWVYYTTNTNTQVSGVFFGYIATSGQSRIYIFKYSTVNSLTFRIQGADLSGGSTYYSEAIIPININNWNFFTWVATSTSWTIYMNGTTYISGVNMNFGYVRTSTPVFAINATFQRNHIGSINGGSNNFKDGKIDNFFIYNAALTSTQVADIYSKGQVPNPTNYYYTVPIQYYQPKLFLSYTGFRGGSGFTGITGFLGPTGRVGPSGITGIYGITGNTGVYGGTGITGGTGYTGYVGEVGAFLWGTEFIPSTLDVQDNVIYTKPVYTKTLGAGWIRDGATIQARLEGGLPRVELVYGLNVGSDVGGGGNDILITLATDASGNSGVSRSLDGKQYTYPFNALTISGGVVPRNIFWDGLKWILTPSMSYSYDGIQFYTNTNAYGIVSIAIGGRRLGSGNGEGKNLYIGIGTAGIYQSFDGFHWYFVSGILTASVGGRVLWYGNGWMATGVQGIAQGSSDGLTWALVSSGTFGGTGGGLDLVWSGERWLAVGAATSKSGTVMSTSLNGGTSWSKVDISYALVASPVFGKGHEMSLEWNGQVFMLTLTSAVGIYPLWYSLDGLSWTVCNGPLNSSGLLSLESVRWNGSRFLAVGTYGGTSGIIVRSLNGGTTYSQMPYTLMMTPANSPALKDIFHIEYSSNRSIHSLRFPFSETLALGSRPLGGGVIGRSLDEGLTWTWVDISNIMTDIHCGAWNGNRWLIGGHGGNNSNTLATGMDGSQWTACGSRYMDGGVYCIGWSTELHIWVAGGISTTLSGGLMYCTSILGIYFIPALWNSSVIVTSVGGVVWNGVVWVATPLNSGTVFGYSTDGQTWTGVDLSGVVNTISTTAQWNGSYWWMGVVDKSGVSSLAKSFNAITWIVDGPFTDASGNNKVLENIFASADIDIGLATTVSGDIWVSLGGYNDWAMVVATGGNGKVCGGNALSWNEAIFVVGDLSGQLWTSPNGFQWQYSRTFFDTSNSIINGIIWNQPRLGYAFLQTILVASGIRNGGGGGALGYSYDGIQWISCATGAGGLDTRINGIAYGGKTWVAVGIGSGGWIATSFNGRIWTGSTFGVQAGVESLMTEGYDITWNGTIFLAVGVDASGTGVMVSSFDGYTWTRIFQSFGGAGSYVNSITWTGRTWVAYVYGGASTTFICNDVHGVDGWVATNPANTYLMDASSVFLVYGNGTYFTNSSTTIPGITYSASVSNIGYEPHHAFDGLYYWNSGYWKTGSFYDVSSGLYNGSNSTTGIVGLGTVLGDWIQLDISSSSVVVQEYYVSVDLSSNAIKLQQKVTRNGGSIPSTWLVLGSNNGGTTWNVLDSFDWYNSDGVAGNNGVAGGYTFVIRNLFNNTAPYKRYRLIIKRIFAYPGQTGSSMPGSILEWDLMVANPATYQVSRFARPIPTPSGLILFSNGAYRGASGQQLMLVTLGDLSGGIVDYTYNVPGFIGPVSSVLNGLSGIMTGVAFDGYRFAVGDVCGNVVYLANMEGDGYGMQWQNVLNGNVLVSGLSSIYDACSIDGRMCFGGISGIGGSPIMYTTMESGDAVFKPSINASNIFASVTGLCSNEGKGSVYIPNYVWVDRAELFRVMGPRWYDYSAETISLSIECIPNTSLAYPL